MAQRTVGTLQKDPQETRTFKMDWSAHLGIDKIESSSWTIQPNGLMLVANGVVIGNTKTYIVLSGGVDGVSYTVTNQVSISGSSDVYERSGTLLVTSL